MRASIIIVCYGQRAVTERCLESLDAALGDAIGQAWELVLVDNASPDDTLELLRAWESRATVVELPSNRNFSGGCNAGATAARGDVLVFLNNDTIVAPGALETLVEQAREPGVGAVGPRLLYPGGTLQHAGVWMIREPSDEVVPYHLFHHEAGDLPAAAIITDLDCVTAACLVMAKACFAAVGGFDEAYANGWEDVDLCLRIRVAGHRIVYRGDVAFVHDEGATRGRKHDPNDNAAIFNARWQRVLEDDLPSFKQIWGATYGPPEAGPDEPADVIVDGFVSGLGPAAAQARAVIRALEHVGRAPAVRDPHPPTIVPRMTVDEWAAIQRAYGREPDAGTPRLDPLRLPAPVLVGACGAGGGGTLAVLPAHDLELSAAILAYAARCPGPLAIYPSARTPVVDALIADLGPACDVLEPATSEWMLAALARLADVVIACDPADRWDRQALVAAGCGAAVVVHAGGPAARVLGDLCSTLSDDPPRPDPGARTARHRVVRQACAPERVLAGLGSVGPRGAVPAA